MHDRGLSPTPTSVTPEELRSGGVSRSQTLAVNVIAKFVQEDQVPLVN
jgi:hypothetical protein